MAIKAVCDACYAVPDREKENCQYKYGKYGGCIEYDKIINVPPADVRPVRRGRWKSSCNGWSAFCSVCGEDMPGRVTTPFCPMCGADMGW